MHVKQKKSQWKRARETIERRERRRKLHYDLLELRNARLFQSDRDRV